MKKIQHDWDESQISVDGDVQPKVRKSVFACQKVSFSCYREA